MKSKKFKKIRRKIRYPLVYALILSMIYVARIFPRKMWLSLCGFLGGIAYYLASKTRKLTVKHLTMAYGSEKSAEEIKVLSKNIFKMLGKNAGDVIRAFHIHKKEDFDRIRILNGVEHAHRAHEKGKGIVFISAHYGAFEFIATELYLQGFNPLVIGTPMKDERLTKLLWKQRSKLGSIVIERGKENMRLIKTLKSGGTFGILIDQDTRVKSVFADFFGIPCATPVGGTLLAMKTGAAVVPIFIHLREDGFQEVNIYPEVELSRTENEERDLIINSQKFNNLIETEIRKHPAQWMWFHERWKTRPEEMIDN